MTTLRAATVDELRKELAQREAEDRAPCPLPLPEPLWSALHGMIVDGIRQEWSDRYRDEKLRGYVYETAIEAVFGPSIWAALNKRTR